MLFVLRSRMHQQNLFLVHFQLYGLSAYKRLERFAIGRLFSREIPYVRKSKKFCAYSPFYFLSSTWSRCAKSVLLKENASRALDPLQVFACVSSAVTPWISWYPWDSTPQTFTLFLLARWEADIKRQIQIFLKRMCIKNILEICVPSLKREIVTFEEFRKRILKICISWYC